MGLHECCARYETELQRQRDGLNAAIQEACRQRDEARAELARLREENERHHEALDEAVRELDRGVPDLRHELKRLRSILAGEDEQAVERAARALFTEDDGGEMLGPWPEMGDSVRAHWIGRARAALAAAAGEEKPCRMDAFCVRPDGHSGQHAANRDAAGGESGDPRTLADAAIDGLACIVCGEFTGAMTPAGSGPRGQLFRHPGCAAGEETGS